MSARIGAVATKRSEPRAPTGPPPRQRRHPHLNAAAVRGVGGGHGAGQVRSGCAGWGVDVGPRPVSIFGHTR
ncbi:hypothetical protein OG225_21230 [Nocardia sp. NBC_01377]